jgi:hypothetical protein
MRIVVGALVVLSLAVAAEARELVRGGAAMQGFDPAPDSAALGGGPGDPVFTMSFTPRGVGRSADPQAGPSLSVDLGRAVRFDQRLDGLSLSTASRTDPGDSARALRVGGALNWQDWSVGGSITQSSIGGTPTALVGATVGYAGFRAQMSYGGIEEGERAGSELWILNTDVQALPWLSLEGDLAIQQRPDTEPETVGRVGVKLRF